MIILANIGWIWLCRFQSWIISTKCWSTFAFAYFLQILGNIKYFGNTRTICHYTCTKRNVTNWLKILLYSLFRSVLLLCTIIVTTTMLIREWVIGHINTKNTLRIIQGKFTLAQSCQTIVWFKFTDNDDVGQVMLKW